MSLITEQVEKLRELSKQDKLGLIPWNGYSGILNQAADTIEQLAAKVQAANMERSTAYYNGGWIPVKERLPEEREWYLAVFKETDTGFQLIPRVADYIGHGKNKWRFIDEDGLVQEYRDILECIAWMPLPEPYKEGEKQ